MELNNVVDVFVNAVKNKQEVAISIEFQGFSENRITKLEDVSLSYDEKKLTVYDVNGAMMSLDLDDGLTMYSEDEEILVTNSEDDNVPKYVFDFCD